MKRIASLFLAALSTIGVARADDLDKLVGRWSRDGDGEEVQIQPTMLGWELWHSRYGQFSLVKDGTAGANIKMSGRGPTPGSSIDCYYRIVVLSDLDHMNWAYRAGDPEACAKGLVKYSHVMGTKSHADEVAEAVAYRERMNRTTSMGPDMLKGIDVVYFDRPADNEKVRNALDLNSVAFSTRDSVSMTAANVVTCTPDVPLDATKEILRVMIRERVPIRVLRPSQFPQFPKRLTIESLGDWTLREKLITSAEVDNLRSCELHNSQPVLPPGTVLYQPNAQPRGRVRVNIPSRDPFSDFFRGFGR